MTELERRTIRKITWRLVPFLMVCYLAAFLDRTNVAFAHVHMVADLKMSETAFGLGAGVFFIAYFLVEVPSNILLLRFGARRWIARIMISWGVVSGGFAFIPQISSATGMSGERVFLVLRFLLGLAEAGFYPGIIFYLTMWFPKAYRARIVGFFMVAIPLSQFVGAPLSGILLNVEGLGLSGWQWLYVLEALPSLILGLATLVVLPDFPNGVRWLKDDEKEWLIDSLRAESLQADATADHQGFVKAMLNPLVLALSFVYFLNQAAGYSAGLFLPGVFAKFGYSNTTTGWLLSIPPVIGILGIMIMCRSSDYRPERKYHLALCFAIFGVGLIGAALATHDVLALLTCVSMFAFGSAALTPIFWTIPPSLLKSGQLAAGIAAVNSLGALGGFIGPTLFGYVKDYTGSDPAGLMIAGATALVGSLIVLTLKIRRETPVRTTSSDPAIAIA
jgi:MFS transporter, ACS family, tartrate transporter